MAEIKPHVVGGLLDLDVYETFRQYLKHEDNLSNQRITWMLTIHGFLYAAYALTIHKKLEISEKLNYDLVKHTLIPVHQHLHLYKYLKGSMYQIEFVIILLALIGFSISFVAYRSIRAAHPAAGTVQDVFERQFSGCGLSDRGETLGKTQIKRSRQSLRLVITNNGLRLPTIAGGGDSRNVLHGLSSARAIPVFLMIGWVASLIFEIRLLCVYGVLKV